MKTKISLVVSIVLVIAILIVAFRYTQANAPKSTQTVAPTPTAISTPTVTPMPTGKPTATPDSRLTVKYLELSRNETMIVIQLRLEPNSYVFQLNATSFYLVEDDARISTSINDVVIIGTQYSTLLFPINNYSGVDYRLTSDVLPLDTIWLRQ